MSEVIDVKAYDDLRLEIIFSDNHHSVIDIKPFIRGGISDRLLDKNYFKSVKIDEFGGICWENGFDFCPNFLKSIAQ